ncbi:glycosyltransferase family 2 protein [candidate division KSB1 bacterium]|nr:glycosyltransferase family 2 protein [candidate division KSB1 bacterium]NIR68781.1 glycosyltransferase family 2 protein [candidate division KSB1 bacterium]NIS28113.1 glycosyltransferase family 2 protein [candidate division KSB1 bacterium]NIT75009.1 glycosyltransferase family 2 protein [candidate division KSB1 bacterium]NIU28793.1 glycosyltransferase family 2 protein [candidate division KSB1 bacterium]
MNDTDVKISLLVPLLNEEESLVELHRQINEVVCTLEKPVELVFIDDGSTDGSFQVLKDLHKRDSKLRVFQFRKNYGKSAALALGFHKARGQIIITMDADLQDDPQEIPNLIKKLNEGYDLVSGWKKHRKDNVVKRITSKLFNRVTSLFTGLKIHDINCGLKAYRREVTDTIEVYGQLHRFLPVLAQWEGFRVGEVVVEHHPRKYGKTKFGLSRFSAGFFDLITVLFITRYTKRPLHLFGLAGLVSFLFGFLINVYLTIERIFFEKYLSNRPLLFLGIVLIIVGVQFVSIGLLGEMITASRKGQIDYSVKNVLEQPEGAKG